MLYICQELPIEQMNLSVGGGGGTQNISGHSIGHHQHPGMLILGNGGLAAVMTSQHHQEPTGGIPHIIKDDVSASEDNRAEPMDVKPVLGWSHGEGADMKQQSPWSGLGNGLEPGGGGGKMGVLQQSMLGSPPPTPSSVVGGGIGGCETGGSNNRWPTDNDEFESGESDKLRLVAAHEQQHELARLAAAAAHHHQHGGGGLRMDGGPSDIVYREYLERQQHLHHHNSNTTAADEDQFGDGGGYSGHGGLSGGPPHSPSILNDGLGDPRSPNDNNVEGSFSPDVDHHLHGGGHHHLHHHPQQHLANGGGGGVLMHNGDGGGIGGGGGGGASAASKKSTSRRNAWGNLSYADLITQAILSSPEKRLTLSQVYDWMVQNIPYFKDKGDSNSSAGWKVGGIIHNNF